MTELRVTQLEEALDAALLDQGLHPGFKAWIRRLVFDEKDDWRMCCGNHCEPCVLPMATAVDQVRKQIGWQEGEGEPSLQEARR